MFGKNKKVRTETILVVVLSVLIGFLSGILGGNVTGDMYLKTFPLNRV